MIEMTKNIIEWELISRKDVFSAPPWMKVCVDTVSLTNGRPVDDYYRIDAPDFLMVCILDREDNILNFIHLKKWAVR